MEQNAKRIDLSTLTRDDLRELLSIAKKEWQKYDNCRENIERCKTCIEKEEWQIKEFKKAKGLLCFFLILMIVTIIALPIVLHALNKNIKKCQNRIMEYETQILELQKKEAKAINEFNKVWDVPDEYCYDYAFTKMLRYIDSFKAHNWKEVTTLYDKHVHEQTLEDNTRIAADEAIKQTSIARETRNAAMAAAAGAWVSALRR